MSKKDKPVYAFVRSGKSLVPEMEMDAELLESIQQGQRVIIDLRHGRNLKRLRAYWKMLHNVIEATGCAPNVIALHSTIKLETGHVEHCRLSNGMTVAVPSSISFESMKEQEMISFFKHAEEWLASEYDYVQPDREAA